ncbi:hypothetical protein L2E82_28806 [Cichorium intybus]|uniref:Uncharacterized protein n=1 Tax=Cichorium intybus TaxID=13427 RepID=A0ACB9CWN8_CICIN|nr:hypothetical protein L2E82_28806 [Cichorium intybus]
MGQVWDGSLPHSNVNRRQRTSTPPTRLPPADDSGCQRLLAASIASRRASTLLLLLAPSGRHRSLGRTAAVVAQHQIVTHRAAIDFQQTQLALRNKKRPQVSRRLPIPAGHSSTLTSPT